MGNTARKTPDTITGQEFQDALGRYDQVLEAITASKGTKSGQRSLAELDKFRYEEAPSLFALEKPDRPMQLDDVKTLVEWKLKHGKFRPTLMKLVTSNDYSFVEDTIKEALDLYKKASDTQAALGVLTKLKGIGPATASLLLAVCDPENVVFFSDEAFYWLCCDGKKAPIKYNAKEYRELSERARVLAKRLKVTAVDIERVAYVLMNDAGSSAPAADPPKTTEKAVRKGGPEAEASKRKKDSVIDEAPTVRRSKRARRA